jgi:hypothetical protein
MAACVLVTVSSGIYAAVSVALAGPLPLPVEAIRPPRDSGPLPTVTAPTRSSRIDPVLSRVASELAGREVEVRCWSARDWRVRMTEYAAYYGEPVTNYSGYVSWEDKRIQLPGKTCDQLRVVGKRALPLEARAWAAEVFTHELQHAEGMHDEARAECYSYQEMAEVARRLGASPREARLLALFAWAEFYPPDDPDYSSPHCHDGGALDLHPRSSVWP